MRIISKEGLKSDLDSLERMVISLSTEKFSYTPEQVAQMSEQIRAGDLTEVMKLYENDIKHPVRSAITGTLIRTLLIQIQKTKVDIDFALTGIDKLLRSQELTFEFVRAAEDASEDASSVLGPLILFDGSRGCYSLLRRTTTTTTRKDIR
ncbi:unnamed protein product [Rhizoctonia solani]|uniref:Uncharacterized protein n=1 Tax=Rhizoctonia solani TaxID=456999 RepID=A0A8H3B903_9AGAM|nr:unnamed protein product [Rhizoctonia solani]